MAFLAAGTVTGIVSALYIGWKIVQELRDEGLPVLKTLLSASVRIKESHQKATPMIHFDRGHKLSQEFSALYKELTGGKRT